MTQGTQELFDGFTVAQHVAATVAAQVKAADVTPALGFVYGEVCRRALVTVADYIGRPLTSEEVAEGAKLMDAQLVEIQSRATAAVEAAPALFELLVEAHEACRRSGPSSSVHYARGYRNGLLTAYAVLTGKTEDEVVEAVDADIVRRSA